MMRRSGRVGIVTVMVLAVVVGIVFIGILIFGNRNSPTSEATKFMDALAQSNVKELTNLTYMPGETRAQIEKKWDFTVNVAGKYYVFTWYPTGEKKASANSAGVVIEYTADARKPGSYPQESSIPMVRVKGKWKVDIRSMDRNIYPGLPR